MSNKIYKPCKCIDYALYEREIFYLHFYFYDPKNIFIDTDGDEYLEIYSNSSTPRFLGRYLAKHFKRI